MPLITLWRPGSARDRGDYPHLRRHGHRHPGPDRRVRHRRHRGALPGILVWALSAHLARLRRIRPALDRCRASVMVLLAVGSDYNLLVINRFKEELHAGMKTGLIRALGSTGAV